MADASQILRSVYPERDGFSEAEVTLVRDVLSFLERKTGSRAVRMPSRYVMIGDTTVVEGRRYLCVERRPVQTPAEACSGCDFSIRYRNCDPLKCSSFDRADRTNVWFHEIDSE